MVKIKLKFAIWFLKKLDKDTLEFVLEMAGYKRCMLER